MKSFRYWLLGAVYVLCAPLFLAVRYASPNLYATLMFFIVHGFNYKLANAWASVFALETGNGKTELWKKYNNFIGMHVPSSNTLATGGINGDGGRLAIFRCQWDGAYESYLYMQRFKMDVSDDYPNTRDGYNTFLLSFADTLVKQKYSTNKVYGGLLVQNAQYTPISTLILLTISAVLLTSFLVYLLIKLIRYVIKKQNSKRTK